MEEVEEEEEEEEEEKEEEMEEEEDKQEDEEEEEEEGAHSSLGIMGVLIRGRGSPRRAEAHAHIESVMEVRL